jgi:hypothetical protein
MSLLSLCWHNKILLPANCLRSPVSQQTPATMWGFSGPTGGVFEQLLTIYTDFVLNPGPLMICPSSDMWYDFGGASQAWGAEASWAVTGPSTQLFYISVLVWMGAPSGFPGRDWCRMLCSTLRKSTEIPALIVMETWKHESIDSVATKMHAKRSIPSSFQGNSSTQLFLSYFRISAHSLLHRKNIILLASSSILSDSPVYFLLKLKFFKINTSGKNHFSQALYVLFSPILLWSLVYKLESERD